MLVAFISVNQLNLNVYNNWHGNVRTQKIEELLLARMHPVLEHRSFSVVGRIRFLEQNLGFVIAYQLRTAVRGFNDNMPRETTQRTSGCSNISRITGR